MPVQRQYDWRNNERHVDLHRRKVKLGAGGTPTASCVVSLASFAFDGPVTNALWAVDGATVTAFVNVHRGSGTADLQVTADLAVRGASGIVLRNELRRLSVSVLEYGAQHFRWRHKAAKQRDRAKQRRRESFV